MEFAMRFCTECGAAIADDKKFCTECGSPVSAETAQPQETVRTETPPAAASAAPVYSAPAAASAPIPAYTAPAPAAPAYTASTAAPVAPVYAAPASPAPQAGQVPPHGSPYAVMSIGSFIGSSVLMSIPVIGWLICIIWACGGCKNHNKRNYARSILVFLIIGLIFYLLIRWMFGGFLNLIQAWIILQGRT
jgi:predicted nucleic acid-binding Zn ribbon protein